MFKLRRATVVWSVAIILVSGAGNVKANELSELQSELKGLWAKIEAREDGAGPVKKYDSGSAKKAANNIQQSIDKNAPSAGLQGVQSLFAPPAPTQESGLDRLQRNQENLSRQQLEDLIILRDPLR